MRRGGRGGRGVKRREMALFFPTLAGAQTRSAWQPTVREAGECEAERCGAKQREMPPLRCAPVGMTAKNKSKNERRSEKQKRKAEAKSRKAEKQRSREAEKQRSREAE